MFTKLTMGLDDAELAASEVLDRVRDADGPVAVAIADDTGDIVHLVRQDGASAVDVQNAERKAYTAAFIGRDTWAYRQQITADGRTVADWSDPKITTLHGGVTVRRQSQVVGAIGVSGSGHEDRDEALAMGAAEVLAWGARGETARAKKAAEPHAPVSDGPPPPPTPGKQPRTAYNLPGLSPEGSVSPDLARVGDLFFTTSVRGVDRATGRMGETPGEQFALAWRNLKALVEGAGLSTGDIGLVTSFISTQDYRPHINPGWLELFPDADNRPARKTTSYVLPPGVGVELQAFGVVGQKRQCIEVPGLTHRDPLPNGVRMGDYVFSSVIVPWDLSTSDVVVGEEEQTDQVFDNMRVFMEQAGGGVNDVVLQWIYLNDFAYQPYMVDVYLDAWPIGSFQAARKTFRYPMGTQTQMQVIGRIGGERRDFEIPGHEHHDPIPMGARIGDLYCSSGVSGVNTGGPDKLEPVNSAAGQAQYGLSNVKTLVEAGGGTLDDIGHITVLIQDYADLPAIDTEWVKMFPDPGNRPARHIMRMGAQRVQRAQFHMIAVV